MSNLIRFLGSLRIAVPLLIAIAAVLAWGTIYETRYGTAAVQRFVYQSAWFQALLGFLAVNLAVAALQRYPWKRKHLPFVLAHLGIILTLIGGIIGGKFGIEGQLIVPEGQTNGVLQLPNNVLVVHQPNPGFRAEFPTSFEATAWNNEPHALFEVPLEGRTLQVVVDRYYPNAVRSERIEPDGAYRNPAVRVSLSHEGHSDETWLLALDPDRFGARWGSGHIFFLDPASHPVWANLLGGKPAPGNGMLEVRFPKLDRTFELPVPKRAGGRPVPVPGTPYSVEFKQLFTDFAVTGEGVVNRSPQPNNPAVALVLRGPEGEDARLVFALHPEFDDMHGRTHAIHAHMTYRHPAGASLPPQSIALVVDEQDRLSAVVTDAAGKRSRLGRVEAGRPYAHPSLGYTFTVADWYPRAHVAPEFSNRNSEVKNEALHVTVRDGENVSGGWVPLREPLTLPQGNPGDPVVVEYRPALRELPFAVKLIDFRKIDYPGIQMAAGFESDIELIDERRGVALQRKISMNNPLKYRGWTLFQSSFALEPVETTVLAVRNDPGVPLVYAGFLIIIAGVVSLFATRPAKRSAHVVAPAAEPKRRAPRAAKRPARRRA